MEEHPRHNLRDVFLFQNLCIRQSVHMVWLASGLGC